MDRRLNRVLVNRYDGSLRIRLSFFARLVTMHEPHEMPQNRINLLDQLARASYAGEVAVAENELAAIAAAARETLSAGLFITPHTRDRLGLLLIFAVNCAYYDFDDDGFWVHFLRRVGEKNEIETQEAFGKRIERSLESWLGKRNEREGPWRYVGAVLEETGIARRHIPQFARLLGTSAGEWRDIVLSAGTVVAHRSEAANVGRFLRQFLTDPAGRQFTVDVARLLVAWSEGRISKDDLAQAVGFRPTFFEELMREFGPVGVSHSSTSPRLQRTRIIFDDSLELAGLSFDAQFVAQGRVRLDGERVWLPFKPFSRSEWFQSRISFELDGHPRSVHFWEPSQQTPCALFHRQLGFVPHGDAVLPGQYYLITKGALPLPNGITALSDFSFLRIEDGDFRYWLIEIEDGHVGGIPGYGSVAEEKETPALTWALDSQRFEGAVSGVNVFIQNLPGIRVSRPELFGGQSGWAMFAEVQGKRTRISNVRAEMSIDSRTGANLPFDGRIWIEHIGRGFGKAGDSVSSELLFVVLPQIGWIWPHELHAPRDEPQFALESAAQFEAKFLDCDTLPGGRRWRAPKMQSLIQGVLLVENLQVPIARQLYRARCQVADLPERTGFEVGEFCGATRVRLFGFPSEGAHLAISSHEKEHHAILRGRPFDRTGLWEGPGVTFSDALRNWDGVVGALEIHDNGRWVQTDTRLFDSSAIENWLVRLDSESLPLWFSRLSENESTLLLECRFALHKAGSFSRREEADRFPLVISQLIQSLFCLAELFRAVREERRISDLPMEVDGIRPAWLEVSRWVRDAAIAQAEFVAESVAADLVARYDRLPFDSFPSILAWQEWLVAARESLSRFSSIDAILTEWNADVRNAGAAPFRSTVARLNGGGVLSQAYRTYLRSFHTPGGLLGALGEAQRALEAGEHGLIRPLSLILCALIRKRTNADFRAHCAPPPGSHKGLLPFFWALMRLAGIEAPISEGRNLPILPVPDSDLLLFASPHPLDQ